METSKPVTRANIWGKLTDPSKNHWVKVRLAQVFRRANMGAMEILNEIGKLSPKDIQDFSTLFCEAGYPTSTQPIV